MMFIWNISEFISSMLPPSKRSNSVLDWCKVLLKNTQFLYADFVVFRSYLLKKMRYNGQVIILENLLNDLFDDTNRGIRIITTYDTITPIYIAQVIEVAPLYVGQPTEPPIVYIGQPEEYGVKHDFIVIVPTGILTTLQETRLKSVVNYYKLAGKIPFFIYINNNPF